MVSRITLSIERVLRITNILHQVK